MNLSSTSIHHPKLQVQLLWKYHRMGHGSESRWRNWYTFEFIFQVWRPSSAVNITGYQCYSLVDDFQISITLSERVASLRVVPSPQDQLQFHSGYVLGFYVGTQGDCISDFDNRAIALLVTVVSWCGMATLWMSQLSSPPSLEAAPTQLEPMESSTHPHMHAAPVISVSVMTTSLFSHCLNRYNILLKISCILHLY